MFCVSLTVAERVVRWSQRHTGAPKYGFLCSTSSVDVVAGRDVSKVVNVFCRVVSDGHMSVVVRRLPCKVGY